MFKNTQWQPDFCLFWLRNTTWFDDIDFRSSFARELDARQRTTKSLNEEFKTPQWARSQNTFRFSLFATSHGIVNSSIARAQLMLRALLSKKAFSDTSMTLRRLTHSRACHSGLCSASDARVPCVASQRHASLSAAFAFNRRCLVPSTGILSARFVAAAADQALVVDPVEPSKYTSCNHNPPAKDVVQQPRRS